MDWHQGTTTNKEGITRESKHHQDSNCGHYRVSAGKRGEQWKYHAWVKSHDPIPGALYRSGTSPWWCIAVTDDPAEAKRICAEHATERWHPADDAQHRPPVSRSG